MTVDYVVIVIFMFSWSSTIGVKSSFKSDEDDNIFIVINSKA